MKHFVCTGWCEGESSNPGVCQAEGCKKEGEPLLSCACADGRHASVLGKDESETDDDTE